MDAKNLRPQWHLMAEQRLKKDNIRTEKDVEKIVRKAIKEAGRSYARRFNYT